MLKLEIKGLKELQRQLNKLEREIQTSAGNINRRSISLRIPLGADAQGYVDRQCPKCSFLFKISESSWAAQDNLYCPSCKHTAGSDLWETQSQSAAIQRIGHHQANIEAEKIANAEINRALAAAGFSRKSSRSYFPRVVQTIPTPASEPMRQYRSCKTCQCHYTFIGAAYNCPLCGAIDYEKAFAHNLETIRKVPEVIRVLRKNLDVDDAERNARMLIENAIEDIVTQFQTYAEYMFTSHPTAPQVRPNLFQNLNEGSKEWQKLTGKTYQDMLSAPEYTQLNRYFQMRHKFGHTDGRVDAKYLQNSQDTHYQIDQRLIAKETDIISFADLCQKLINGMKASL